SRIRRRKSPPKAGSRGLAAGGRTSLQILVMAKALVSRIVLPLCCEDRLTSHFPSCPPAGNKWVFGTGCFKDSYANLRICLSKMPSHIQFPLQADQPRPPASLPQVWQQENVPANEPFRYATRIKGAGCQVRSRSRRRAHARPG